MLKPNILSFCSIADMCPMLKECAPRRGIDETMNKREGTKLQAMIYKLLHRKLKIEHHKPHLIPGWTILISCFYPDCMVGTTLCSIQKQFTNLFNKAFVWLCCFNNIWTTSYICSRIWVDWII